MRRTLARPGIASSALAGVVGLLSPANALAHDKPPRPGATVEAPPLSPAEDAASRARARYDAGTGAFAQSRFVEAALEFEAAAAEKSNPVALYTAALAWERANAPERAADDYARALAIGGLAGDAASSAGQRLATLDTMLGSVTVRGPKGCRAQLDAGTEAATPATLHGAAGVHTLTVRPLGRPITRLPLVLRSGVATPLDLPLQESLQESTPAPSQSLAPSPAPHAADVRQTIGLVALGAAGAAFLGATLLGVEALDARNAYEAAPMRASYDHASNLQRWTNVAWIAGGTLLAGGLALVLWPAVAPRKGAATCRGILVGIRGPGAVLKGDF